MPRSKKVNAPSSPARPWPLLNILGYLVHSLDGVRECATALFPAAIKYEKRELLLMQQKLARATYLLKRHGSEVAAVSAAMPVFQQSLERTHRFQVGSLPVLLPRSLFYTIFSIFDSFMGRLLRCLYENKPDLMHTIDRELSIDELLDFTSLEAVKAHIIDKEIEFIRRESYVEQFKRLEKKFAVSLRVFEQWPLFVECTQRRNILMHCDGKVSQQYLRICKDEGVDLPSDRVVGKQLDVSVQYLIRAIDLLNLVAFMLAQVLWRQLFPKDVDRADESAVWYAYGALTEKQWTLAEWLGKCSLSLTLIHDDATKRLLLINYAQALKWNGKTEESEKALATMDWSASIADFRLGVCILSNDYDGAIRAMKEMGKEGQYVNQGAYAEWPLFRRFRRSRRFLQAYNDIFGVKFSSALLKLGRIKISASRSAAKGGLLKGDKVERRRTHDK
jgi:hypothetical protein